MSTYAQELSSFNIATYCGNAASALLFYDWLLSLDQEVIYIWNSGWSKITGSLLVYALSRYLMLIQSALAIATNFPMSDLSCRATIWAQIVVTILSPIPVSAFSALRAYALSNRNPWLVALIITLALPPTVIAVVQSVRVASENLPSPFNCSASVVMSQTFSIIAPVVVRASQLASELLVVCLTWWYTYQSYRIRKGLKLQNTISSLLLYNGSLYFLFLAMLYIIDIIFNTAPVPDKVFNADSLMTIFYDPIISILVCHFMLSLRQFDTTAQASMPFSRISGLGSQPWEHAGPVVLGFAAPQSDSLPSFIASFAHPVHVDPALPETDADAGVNDEGFDHEWEDMEVGAPTRMMSASYNSKDAGPSWQRPDTLRNPAV